MSQTKERPTWATGEIDRLTLELKATRKRELALKKSLTELCEVVRRGVDELDAHMEKRPDRAAGDRERGSAIALTLNALEWAHDAAWHFGLGRKLRARRTK